MPTTATRDLPYPAPADTPDVPYFLQQLAEAVDADLSDALTPDHAIAAATAVQSLPNNATTVVTYGTAESAKGCTVNLATGEITATRAGLYRIDGCVTWVAVATGMRSASLIVSGTGVAVSTTTGATGTFNGCTVSALVRLTAGQVITLASFQNSGGALNTGTTYNRNRLSVSRVGE